MATETSIRSYSSPSSARTTVGFVDVTSAYTTELKPCADAGAAPPSTLITTTPSSTSAAATPCGQRSQRGRGRRVDGAGAQERGGGSGGHAQTIRLTDDRKVNNR
ncbi:hypothetical protein Q9Q99_14330 [Curtobacterium flaccumfaciens]|nr:hypothetical protein Q9Q99_14330 [Curtobacterium flaccumfaciens]